MRGLLFPLLLALAHPAAAGEKVWRVGLLSNGPPPSVAGQVTTWRDEALQVLAQNGFTLGRNLELVERYSGGDPDGLPRLAGEINAAGVDVIIAIIDVSVRAAQAATQTTPIVMVIGDDPVAMALVAILAHPGDRITGIVYRTPEGDAKRLQLLSETIPGARRFGYLGIPSDSAPKAEAIARAAAQLTVEVMTHRVDGPAEYGPAFAAMRNEAVAGVVVVANQPLATHARQVVAGAAENGLPTICEWDYMARAGCVLGYGHDLAYGQRRVGEYVARILKGANPAELPVEQPDAWKLTINLRAAARLGLTIPPAILARADEVIE